MGIELKDYVGDPIFIEKMNKAFADLRADYELSLDTSKEKIKELKSLHVDHKNNLANLVSLSTVSSGVLSGLRGTGKTHLFLLARDAINNDVLKNKAICIYLNVKRLHLPQNFDQELFNRVFSLFVYDEFVKQLTGLLHDINDTIRLQSWLTLFSGDKRKFIRSIDEAIEKIIIFRSVVYHGSQRFENLDKGNVGKEQNEKELIELKNEIVAKLNFNNPEFSTKLSTQYLNEISQKISENNTYLDYLNIQDVRNQFLETLSILNLKSITFYVDEWEKLYYNQKAQEYLAFFIDRIIDTPFYFWVGYVPHRGRLYNLENGADLQHYFNLDESLVYEISGHDKTQCMNYFKKLVDNRLNYYFKDLPISYATLFNNDHKFEMLVLASMGNSRDFGTMLLDCWTEYQAYRTNPLSPGRPYKYISDSMIVASIKKNGDKKFSNIRDDKTLLFVWKDLENFCINRKSSHFAIEELKENFDVMYNEVYSALIYHRLLHFRKGHVSPKEPTYPNKLSIYALNYAGIYDLHAKERKITFITDYDSIHDKVRRYIYNPVTVIENIRIREGELFPCKSCSNNINVTKMKAAWEKNSCPFCGGIIYNV